MTKTVKTIKLEEGQRVFFTSDSHYNHKNICRGVSSWLLKDHGGNDSVRDFDTVEEMNDTIVKGINDTVGIDDYLIHLGDWSFGGKASIAEFRDRILCKNVILVLGNHDEHIESNKPIPFRVTAQNLFQGVFGRLQLKVKQFGGGYNIYECNHFPWAIWDKGHHGRIHLYGHVHGSYVNPGRAMDVGVDSIGFNPISEKGIEEYMEGREYQQMSHHNKKTN